MVDALVRERANLGMDVLLPEVEDALRTVPRECFVPGLPLADSYDQHQAVVTKRAPDTDMALSSVSAPSIIATMLNRADLRPGQRVLEIGSGGYNAALIRHMIGDEGKVTSIDIDPEVIARAEGCLREAGTDHVHLAVADGEHGFPAHAPYERIIVTAGAWDVPPTWDDQLAAGGRLVVPMRVRGLTRCLTLERGSLPGWWRCLEVDMCGFVRMRGSGEHWERMPLLHEREGERVGLRLEDGPRVDTESLRASLEQEAVTLWADASVRADEPTDGQDLYLACQADGWALLTAQRGAIASGLLRPVVLSGTPALVDEDGTGFAYRTLRRSPHDQDRWEFGATGHGPHAHQNAQAMVDLIEAWDRDRQEHPSPRIDLVPASTPLEDVPTGRVVTKRHTRMVLNWTSRTPQPSCAADGS
ncbi:protein-L-isoaspartate(D-aspartate) O-methyltransferase [Haloactinospora alba]|uniref:Protein-L-isoaspartate O-methyltransferase n=2 Tax=Haloactinospora alba TaxID=405555 RepID=A0A543NN36_9ACTN|nr:protein-L-isoaspartate(D-aspartate) O-methyltransferase [Haloactinospora alba]